VSGVLFELFLIGEEALYYGLRMLFLQKPFGWEDISGTFLSPANLVMLVVLALCCVSYSSLNDKKLSEQSEQSNAEKEETPETKRVVLAY
jgi:branched-subunit amino acid permease